MNNQEKKRCTAIVLAAGSGSRMKSDVAKQFMMLDGKPLIWYALNAVETSDIIDDCVLVTGADDIAYVRKEIVEKYGFGKVVMIVAGGAERYLSVGNALDVIAGDGLQVPNKDGYVFIHDGARPFLTEEILSNTYETVQKYHACVAAMPVKDTVKIADAEGFAATTPDRKLVWAIQTPQVFDTQLILCAYDELRKHQTKPDSEGVVVTDDASVVELFTDKKVKLVEGSYINIKITTPEDISTAEGFLKQV
uniref:2-C-methyl-D-erythritol 4-phosphate cytidylyltransferase n=1 Tax=Acetatifactor sp. TaxID=1872090 RepID=UPI00405743A1